MKARIITCKGTIEDEEYFAIEFYGKEFTGKDNMPVSIVMKTPMDQYENVEEVQSILELIIGRVNDN